MYLGWRLDRPQVYPTTHRRNLFRRCLASASDGFSLGDDVPDTPAELEQRAQAFCRWQASKQKAERQVILVRGKQYVPLDVVSCAGVCLGLSISGSLVLVAFVSVPGTGNLLRWIGDGILDDCARCQPHGRHVVVIALLCVKMGTALKFNRLDCRH
jgi:hypothetical protein